MRNVGTCMAVALIAVEALVSGQGRDINEVLAGARKALGGDKLAAVKTLTAMGRTVRTGQGGNTVENEFEMALELPDKYLLRSVMMAMGNMSIYRNTGFNGAQPIEEIDRPPNLSGGTFMMRVAGPGGTPMDPAKMTPEQKAESDRMRLLANKREFAKLALGMFAASPAAFPLTLADAGQAESADGKADAIDVKREGEFTARLFVDAATHLPLMLSWMEKEPLQMQMAPGGTVTSGGGGTVMSGGGGAHVIQTMEVGMGARGSQTMSKEEREKRQQELAAQLKEAEAKRRMVEYRVFYTDYQSVGGVQLPHRIQKSIDGRTTEEMIFDSFKINPKIDAKKFAPSK